MLLLLLLLSTCQLSVGETRDKKDPKPSKSGSSKSSTKNGEALPDSSSVKSMFQEAEAARERYWQKTLEEIRTLTGIQAPKQEETSLNRWKTFSRPSSTLKEEGKVTPPQPPRYNGFLSWERLLQEWAEDIQEYMDNVEAEGKDQGYPMATFGGRRKEDGLDKAVPTKSATTTPTTITSNFPEPLSPRSTKETTTSKKSKTTSHKEGMIELGDKVPRPIPAPRKEGEAVLPHTDVSDKSKNVWIVTTASLPWMTGTAVNPLLRAAYMTDGRKEAGGSVTLMLPWLERKEDQDALYGADRAFETPEDQEAHVRDWLKNSANMKEASEELKIRWYTAWQSKIENSVYSMGDIVATISEDEVDIMVLEEPEHLNW